jgi:hypothetical protein
VPAGEYRRRFAEQQRRQTRRTAPSFATVGFAGAVVIAALTGAAIAVFAAPHRLSPVPSATAGTTPPAPLQSASRQNAAP